MMNPVSSLFIAFILTYSKSISGDEGVISTFFKGYDKAVRPDFGTGKPTTIRASLYVESFGNIEEANMEYKVYIYFRQLWNDSRLAGKLNRTLTIKGGEIDNVWIPDPYCYNARESNMMMPNEEINSYVKIRPNGDVASSIGATLLASCVMNLREFPMDSQTCYLQFGSYAYSTNDIVYEWIPGEVAVGSEELAQFEYKGAKLSSNIGVFILGNFSTIKVTFSFERRIGYFLIQVYFPTIFVVMLSWIVFYMEKDDIGNRMALGITTILTIMFLLGSLNGNLPKVSYPKALDWYLLVSFGFLFFCLIECMIVYLFTREATKNQEKIKLTKNSIPLAERFRWSVKSVFGSKTDDNAPTSDTLKDDVFVNRRSNNDLEMVGMATKADKVVVEDGSHHDVNSRSRRMKMIANAIENASRILFPLVFICYNIFYWTNY